MRATFYLAATVSICALLTGTAGAEQRYYYRNPSAGGVLASDMPELGANNVGKRLVARPQAIPSTPSAGDPATGSFIAIGGTAPYTFKSTTTLPVGVDLNPDGSLTGAFSRVGTYTLGAAVTDAKAATSSVSLDVTVLPALPVFAINSPSTAVAGTPFSASVVQAQGGILTYTLPTQPGWLSVAASGAVTGTVPACAPAFTFDVLGTDVYGRSDRRSSGNISIVAATATVANAPARIVEGDSATGAFTSNMTGATWAKLTGPSWLNVSPAGVISGQSGDVPAGADASVSYSARATLNSVSADASANLAVAPATVSITGLQARSGMAFSLPVSSTMAAPSTYAVTASPSDITGLAASGSAVTGTAPTVTQATTRSVTVTKTASTGGAVASGTATLAVAPRLSFETQPQDVNGTVGTAITTMKPTLAGAIGPTSVSLMQGTTNIGSNLSAYCSGLSFAGATGQVSGAPTGACNLTGLTMKADDASGTALADAATSAAFTIKAASAGGIRMTLPNGYSATVYDWTALPNNVTFRVFTISSTSAWLTFETPGLSCQPYARLSYGSVSIGGWSGNCFPNSTPQAEAAWSSYTGQKVPATGVTHSMGSLGEQYSSQYYSSGQVSWYKVN